MWRRLGNGRLRKRWVEKELHISQKEGVSGGLEVSLPRWDTFLYRVGPEGETAPLSDSTKDHGWLSH